MKTVYVLCDGEDYGPNNVLGVYPSLDDAIAAKKNYCDRDPTSCLPDYFRIVTVEFGSPAVESLHYYVHNIQVPQAEHDAHKKARHDKLGIT